MVGVKGTVVSKDGKDTLTRVGITCALCHSTVDDSVMPGIGRRLDGRPNLTLNPGAIIALSPALDAAKKAVYNSWGPGKYDPRFNQDGKNGPVVIPPAFGLAGVAAGHLHRRRRHLVLEQLRRGDADGRATAPSRSRRLGIAVEAKGEDLVKPKLPALREYQHSLAKPAPPAGSFDAAAAERGQHGVRRGGASARTCHSGAAFTDEKLHAPGGDGDGPRLRRAQRDQEVPGHAPARAVAAPAVLPRRQGGEPAPRWWTTTTRRSS